MPNYTTSYSSKTKPRYRKNTGNQLPGGRRRQQRRKGAQYLRRSQGFGGRRRPGHGYGGNDRRVYALIMVGCAFLLFVASIVWYANRSVEITLNGASVKVRINSDIERVISDQELELEPGDLLAVDDEVLEKGGGTAYTVTLGGKKVSGKKLASIQLEGGEEVTIEDGEDVYEDHDVAATTIEPTLTVEGTGCAVCGDMGQGGPIRGLDWVQDGQGRGQGRGRGAGERAGKVRVGVAEQKRREVRCLTLDEGPSNQTEEIIRILQEKGVKATFFVSGDKVASNSAAVRAIAESGNEIGTNAYSDVDLRELGASDLRDQLTKGFEAVSDAAGTSTALLRPPFGEFSEGNWAAAMDLVSVVVTWNVDSGDWLLQGADSVIETVTGSVSNGDIVLFTDNDATASQTVEALPQLIDRLLESGYKLVTISELIATDDDLADAIDVSRAGLPKGASLPSVTQDSSSGTSE